MANLILSDHKARLQKRNEQILKDFDGMAGKVTAIAKKLSVDHGLSLTQIFKILHDANRIGRNRS